MPEPRTPYGRSLLEVESIVAGLAAAHGVPVCALRYAPVVGSARAEPGRAGCSGSRSCRCPRSPIRRSRCCTPTTRPRRWSPRSTAATTDRSTSSARARRRRGRPSASAVASRCRWSGRAGAWPAAFVGARGRGDRRRTCRAAAPRPNRRRRPRRATRSASVALVPTQTVLRELFEWADVMPIPTRESRERAREAERPASRAGSSRRRGVDDCNVPNYGIDADRVLALDPPFAALSRAASTAATRSTRSGSIRSSRTWCCRSFARRSASRSTAASTFPRRGPAVLVANRGFAVGSFEPAVARSRGAARRAAAPARRRRARGAGRRESALPARCDRPPPPDVAALLRAGHLVGGPARAHVAAARRRRPAARSARGHARAPIVPVAVRPGGPLGLPVAPWRVAVGAPMPSHRTAPDPGDPLARGRAVRAGPRRHPGPPRERSREQARMRRVATRPTACESRTTRGDAATVRRC